MAKKKTKKKNPYKKMIDEKDEEIRRLKSSNAKLLQMVSNMKDLVGNENFQEIQNIIENR